MYKDKNYFEGLFCGVKSIGIGLKTTMREFFTKKITEQYPENRKELKMFDRFRGSLVMPHNEKNEHKCVACGICQMQCPNDTINVVSEMVEVDGKKKKQLVRYEYNLGSCMFCMLCVTACPHNAITFDQSFENAVFDRSKLIKVLNKPGSKVAEKPVVKKPAPVTAEKPATPAAEASKPEAKPAVAVAAAPKTEVKPEAPVDDAPKAEVKPTVPAEEPAKVQVAADKPAVKTAEPVVETEKPAVTAEEKAETPKTEQPTAEKSAE